MRNFNLGGTPAIQHDTSILGVDVMPLMRLVYLWMTIGLAVTAVVAFTVSNNVDFVQTASELYLPIILVQFGLVIGIGWGIKRISANVAIILFFVYAASMGLTMSVILFAFIANGQSTAIANAFVTTAGLFGIMTAIGLATKTDLTRFGSFLMMGLIGLVVASIVNIFLASSSLDWLISIIGVLVFTGLTAYDTQKIKKMASMPEYQQAGESMTKMGILGALILYLDFINLFLFLLSLFGGRRR